MKRVLGKIVFRFRRIVGALKAFVRTDPVLFFRCKRIRDLAVRLVTGPVPDRLFVIIQHYCRFHRIPNLSNPILFNEKLQWLKLYCRDSIQSMCADKYAVREFVRSKIGSEALNELIGVYENAEQISANSLPASFVLKVTHGSGQNLIVYNKDEVDWDLIKITFGYYLGSNHYYRGREWAYKNIKPRIVCERLLLEEGVPPKDYKLFCFNGEPKMVQVDIDRFRKHKRNMYDIAWNLLPFEYVYERDARPVEKPAGLNQMIEYAKALSAQFAFVRVDFYYVNGRVIFGEMTFYPENAGGTFRPEEFEQVFGSYLKLPARPNLHGA